MKRKLFYVLVAATLALALTVGSASAASVLLRGKKSKPAAATEIELEGGLRLELLGAVRDLNDKATQDLVILLL